MESAQVTGLVLGKSRLGQQDLGLFDPLLDLAGETNKLGGFFMADFARSIDGSAKFAAVQLQAGKVFLAVSEADVVFG